MPKQTTKHTHTVQKEYLKNFAVEENGKYLMWRLDKKTGEKIRLPIDKISVENYFYPQEIEDWLANEIEGTGISAIKKVIEQRSVSNLTSKEKYNIAKWIIVQDLRTREYRNELKQGIEETIALISRIRFLPQKYPEVDPNELKVVVGENSLRNLQIAMMIRLQRYTPIIADIYHWSICENNTGKLYYTSDHPVIKDNAYMNSMRKVMNYKHPGSGIGYFSKGVEFHLPLTPDLKLVIRNLEPFDDMLQEIWDAIDKNPRLYSIFWKLYPHDLLKQLKSEKYNTKYENLLYYNEMITGLSNRFILSIDENFQIAEQLLKRSPDYKKENRKRWKIY